MFPSIKKSYHINNPKEELISIIVQFINKDKDYKICNIDDLKDAIENDEDVNVITIKGIQKNRLFFIFNNLTTINNIEFASIECKIKDNEIIAKTGFDFYMKAYFIIAYNILAIFAFIKSFDNDYSFALFVLIVFLLYTHYIHFKLKRELKILEKGFDEIIKYSIFNNK